MRLDNYIITEGRGKGISPDEAYKWIEKNCQKLLKWMRNERRYIARMVSGKGGSDHWLIDPKKSAKPRKSANTFNYYTLIMDNESEWRRFPKRSKSLICRTDGGYRGSSSFVVFPKDGSKIGDTNERDLWMNSRHATDGNFLTLDSWATVINTLLRFEGDRKTYDDSLNEFKSQCQKFDHYAQENGKYVISKLVAEHRSWLLEGAEWIEEQYKYDLYKICKETINPKKMKITLKKSGEDLSAMNEVWTDSECVMINGNYWEDMDISRIYK